MAEPVGGAIKLEWQSWKVERVGVLRFGGPRQWPLMALVAVVSGVCDCLWWVAWVRR